MPGEHACVLAQLRAEAGYTQASFVRAISAEAARLGIDASVSIRQLRRWERESPPPLPHPGQQAALESVFGIPLAEMGFDVPVHRTAGVDAEGQAGEVKRRTFAADVGALAAGALVSREAGSRIGAADVERLRGQLHSLYRTDHTAGSAPAQVRAQAVERGITQALSSDSYTSAVGRDLQGMLSELYSLQAWLGYDGGPVDQARTASVEALTSAQLTGDPMLHISALETLVLLSVKANRVWEASSAVDYAYRLADSAGAGPTVRLVIALREANVAIHTSDLGSARRALSRGMSLLGRMDADTDVPPWARFAGAGEVDYATASMYLRAQQPRRALPFLRSAVGGLESGYTRNSAWYRAKLARVLLQAEEIEEACAEMHAVLDTHDGISSPRLLRRMEAFRERAVGYDTAATRDCAARIRYTIGGSTV